MLTASLVTGCGESGTTTTTSAGGNDEAVTQGKVLRIPMTTNGPQSLDPAEGSTTYENRAVAQVFETLLQYKYLVRPFELEPLMLTELPTISDDGMTWEFELRDDLFFHDSECFEGGVGRKVVSEDVFYSWKRLADPEFRDENWWLLEGVIKGFDEYKAGQLESFQAAVDAGRGDTWTMDYDAPVEGLEVVDDRRFRVVLNKPDYQFKWKLAMFQLSVLPREAVEYFGDKFAENPVGTGPFVVREPTDWQRNKSIVFYRNPDYREAYFPTEARHGSDPEIDAEFKRIAESAGGQRLPLVDRLEYTFFVEENPQWLSFKAGDKDYTTTPPFGYEEAFDVTTGELKRAWEFDGIVPVQVELLDLIFRGFNMDDELVGGYSPEKAALRKAIHACIDYDEVNKTFYNGLCEVYDGPIPPPMDGQGYPPNGRVESVVRGPDYDAARRFLREAGYTIGDDGKVTDLPTIEFYTARGPTQEHTELIQRQLAVIGIELNPHFVDFTTLIEKVNNSAAPMFSYAWGSDYPDPENNFALFLGRNKAPGNNSFNYDRPEFDALYDDAKRLDNSPERTAIYERMRDMLLEDMPYSGSMGRTRTYLIHPWVKNFYPTETFF
ncbi:MAG: ABC transporter substrate-binding protein, partial [Planctomycetota bacterium]